MKKVEPFTRYHTNEQIPLYLDAGEIVKILGLSRTCVYDFMRAVDFPAIQLGNRRLVRREEFFSWLDRHRVDNSDVLAITSSINRENYLKDTTFK